MFDAVESLSALVESPERVRTRSYRVDWPYMQQLIGIEFPGDFKQLVDRYGPGVFSDELYLECPPSASDSEAVQTQHRAVVTDRLEGLRLSLTGTKLAEAVAVWPEPGGLFPWGSDLNGSYLLWETSEPDPQLWPTVVMPREVYEIERFEMTCSEWLLRWVQGELDCSIIPSIPGTPYFLTLLDVVAVHSSFALEQHPRPLSEVTDVVLASFPQPATVRHDAGSDEKRSSFVFEVKHIPGRITATAFRASDLPQDGCRVIVGGSIASENQDDFHAACERAQQTLEGTR